MCYHILKWTGSSSSAHMLNQNPCHWPASGSTVGHQCFSHMLQGYPCWWAHSHSHVLPPHTFPSSLWGFPPMGTNGCPHCSHSPLQHLAPATHSLLLMSLSGPPAHQVPLSHICSASWAKVDEGLQHSTHRVYQCKQRMFHSFCK